ncbi:MAG: InlB B-repeat-containing protein, partial [Chloroflexi bacterium]|nr:InlB B-repeat-containing protein [Chloroflexota bacterium]
MYKFNKRSQQNRRQKREGGQGLTEYALILAFVGIAVVLIVNVMQPIIGNVFSDLANEAPVAPPDLLAFTPPPTGPPVTLTVNLDPVDGSGGNVTVDPPGPKYGPGSTVTLTAVPTDSSWVFIGWEGDLTGTTNPVTLYMSGDKTVTAKFARKQYTLTLNESGNGDASSDPDEAEQFAFGQEVTLSADPDPD